MTQDQRHTLESTYTFLRGATVYLEAVLPCVCPEDETHVNNLLKLGKLCMTDLARSFPEVAEWERLR